MRVDGAKDPDEFIKKFGPGRFQALLDGANNDIEYKLSAAKSKYDVTTEDGRLSALKELAQILADTNDRLARDIYAGKIASEFNVSKDVLTRQIEIIYRSRVNKEKKERIERAVNHSTESNRVNPEKRTHTRSAIAEECIISALYNDPSLYEYINELISPDEFTTKFNARIFEYLNSLLAERKIPDISYFSSSFTPDEMGKIVEICNKSTSMDSVEAAIKDCVKVIKNDNQLQKAAQTDSDDGSWAENIKKITEIKRGSN